MRQRRASPTSLFPGAAGSRHTFSSRSRPFRTTDSHSTFQPSSRSWLSFCRTLRRSASRLRAGSRSLPSGDARAPRGQPRGRPRRGVPGCPRALPRALPRRARGRGRRDRRRGRGGGEVTSRRRRRGSRRGELGGHRRAETRIGASTFPRSRCLTTSAITLVASENLFPSGRRSACAAAGARSAWWTTRTRRATRRADGRPSPQTPWRKRRAAVAQELSFLLGVRIRLGLGIGDIGIDARRRRGWRFRGFLAEARVVGARRLFPRRVLDADAEVRRGRKRRGDRAQPDRAQPARDGPREPTETATPSLFFLYRRRFRGDDFVSRVARIRTSSLVAVPIFSRSPIARGRSLRGHDGLRLVLGVLAEIIQRGFVRVAGRLQRAVRKEHAPLGRVRRRALRLGLGDRVRGRSAVRTDAGARGLTARVPRAGRSSVVLAARGVYVHRGHRAWHSVRSPSTRTTAPRSPTVARASCLTLFPVSARARSERSRGNASRASRRVGRALARTRPVRRSPTDSAPSPRSASRDTTRPSRRGRVCSSDARRSRWPQSRLPRARETQTQCLKFSRARGKLGGSRIGTMSRLKFGFMGRTADENVIPRPREPGGMASHAVATRAATPAQHRSRARAAAATADRARTGRAWFATGRPSRGGAYNRPAIPSSRSAPRPGRATCTT